VDTSLSDVKCLKRLRADVAVGTVSTGSIVFHFNVFKYRLSDMLPGGESLTVNDLDLECVKEALGPGIIVTTAFGAHTAQQIMLADQPPVGGRAVLTAAIRMHDDISITGLWIS